MSSGGMDWAYRMLAAHDLDPLGAAIVLHLGWRDAPSQRTDRGIARSLSQHRSSVCKATAKLAQLGLIVRRSGQWVAVETVKIVEQAPDAPRPDPECDDFETAPGPLSGPDHSVGRGGPLSGPRKDHSVGHKRIEKFREGRGASKPALARSKRRPPLDSGGASPSPDKSSPSVHPDGQGLNAFQRSAVLNGRPCLVGGVMLRPGMTEFDTLQAQIADADRVARSRAFAQKMEAL